MLGVDRLDMIKGIPQKILNGVIRLFSCKLLSLPATSIEVKEFGTRLYILLVLQSLIHKFLWTKYAFLDVVFQLDLNLCRTQPKLNQGLLLLYLALGLLVLRLQRVQNLLVP